MTQQRFEKCDNIHISVMSFSSVHTNSINFELCSNHFWLCFGHFILISTIFHLLFFFLPSFHFSSERFLQFYSQITSWNWRRNVKRKKSGKNSTHTHTCFSIQLASICVKCEDSIKNKKLYGTTE